MFIKLFGVEIENIMELKIAIALEKIYKLKPTIPPAYFSKFIKELSTMEGAQELTEMEILEEFLHYIKEVDLYVKQTSKM